MGSFKKKKSGHDFFNGMKLLKQWKPLFIGQATRKKIILQANSSEIYFDENLYKAS